MSSWISPPWQVAAVNVAVNVVAVETKVVAVETKVAVAVVIFALVPQWKRLSASVAAVFAPGTLEASLARLDSSWTAKSHSATPFSAFQCDVKMMICFFQWRKTVFPAAILLIAKKKGGSGIRGGAIVRKHAPAERVECATSGEVCHSNDTKYVPIGYTFQIGKITLRRADIVLRSLSLREALFTKGLHISSSSKVARCLQRSDRGTDATLASSRVLSVTRRNHAALNVSRETGRAITHLSSNGVGDRTRLQRWRR